MSFFQKITTRPLHDHFLPILAFILVIYAAAACSNADDDDDSSAAGGTDSRYFYFAALADTHIIDDFYEGPEGNALDTETIFHTSENLEAARTVINSLEPPIELAIIAGDFIHNYPSTDYDFYLVNTTRIDIAADLISGFNMPVYTTFGNHDYDIGEIDREFTHRLFEEKLGIDPYYYVDHKGWRFIAVNNFLGETQNPDSDEYSSEVGSLGPEQLQWLDSALDEGLPSFVYLHFPPILMSDNEDDGNSIFRVLSDHADNVKLVISGHLHRWIDYSDSFDPPQMSIGSTRYDPDAYMIVRVDTINEDFEIMNLDQVVWNTTDSEPYSPAP